MRRLGQISTLIGVSIAVFGLTMPNASANSFGGYRFYETGNIFGERSEITAPPIMYVSAHNFVLFRVVLQVPGGGLLQTGIVRTGSNESLDSCGTTLTMKDYTEFHRANPSSPYVCDYVGSHAANIQKLYTVAKTQPQSSCEGCYTPFISGLTVGPGEVSLAYGSNDANAAEDGSVTGESVVYSSYDDAYVYFGKFVSGDFPVQWTDEIDPGATFYTVSASDTSCQDTDDHFYISPYGAYFEVLRSVTSGSASGSC